MSNIEEHAVYAPSAAYRNLSCAGAISLIKKTNSIGKVSKYAEEGTLIHKYIAQAATAFHAHTDYDFFQIANEEMRQYVVDYVMFISQLNKSLRTTHKGVRNYIEHRVTFDKELWGTVDYMLTGINLETGGLECVICDFKYGKGVSVEAEDNEQLICYILCAQKTLKTKFHRAHCFIYQPRTPGEEFSRWSINAETIEKVEQAILVNKEKCTRLVNKDTTGEIHAGEWCRFCPAQQNNNCSVYLEELNSSALKILDEVPVIPDITILTLDQKVEVFKRRKMIKRFMDDIASELLITANSGTKVPGHKIIEGQRRRGWIKDFPTVTTGLIQLGVGNPCVEKLKGIGEIEKEIGKGKIDGLVELSKPTYQLVPNDDKRQEVQSIALEDLEDIEFNE